MKTFVTLLAFSSLAFSAATLAQDCQVASVTSDAWTTTRVQYNDYCPTLIRRYVDSYCISSFDSDDYIDLVQPVYGTDVVSFATPSYTIFYTPNTITFDAGNMDVASNLKVSAEYQRYLSTSVRTHMYPALGFVSAVDGTPLVPEDLEVSQTIQVETPTGRVFDLDINPVDGCNVELSGVFDEPSTNGGVGYLRDATITFTRCELN